MPERKKSGLNPLPPRGNERAEQIQVTGLVQGVGFRPFVFRLAHRLDLRGWVANTVHGVKIEVEGEPAALERFAAGLRLEAPPIAIVHSVRRAVIKPAGHETFAILASKPQAGRTTLVSPDIAVCEDCLKEMHDPADRRWRYPFINCTNCGPRYTIIRDIPYDRANTTMAAFVMCPQCRREFEDPLDRRFHAQPNACPVCGPRVYLSGRDGAEITAGDSDPIKLASRLLLEGAVLAVKGLGGFHLAADATNREAATHLRERKKRQDKPFAVMFAGLSAVRRYCFLTRPAEQALVSPARPIVLLPKRNSGDGLAREVAPYGGNYGALLPYTPLHHLLLAAVNGTPLIMTSGNSSDEPIEIDNREALERLGSIADFFLLHDRPIYMRADDSVVQPVGRRTFPVRRSRGYVPGPIRLRRKMPRVLAVGAHLKNTICILRGREAFLSQHIGDLERPDTWKYFLLTVAQMQRLLEVRPELIGCDLHPDYLTTRWAHQQSGLPVVGVQHHHAHVVSCMAEHGLEGRLIGVSMDGTGYGPDGTLWGGEFLIADEKDYARAAHLPYAPMPGGEAAIRQTWRMARSIFSRALGVKSLESLGLAVWERAGRQRVETVDRMIATDTNCPLTSGCGRLFDAVAALLEVRTETLYEGQPAIELESLALKTDPRKAPRYDFKLADREGRLGIDLDPLLEGIARDAAAGLDPAPIARGFHEGLARVMAAVSCALSQRSGLDRVVLTGGVFNNRLLTRRVSALLRGEGLKVFTHRLVPPGDGGISLGQAVVAARVEL